MRSFGWDRLETALLSGTLNAKFESIESPIGDITPAAGIFTTMLANYTILTDSDIAGDAITAAQAKNGCIILANKGSASEYDIVSVAAGYAIYIKAATAHTITLDPDDSDAFVLIDGTVVTAGNSIVSDGSKGASLLLVAFDATYLWVMAQVGAWSDVGS